MVGGGTNAAPPGERVGQAAALFLCGLKALQGPFQPSPSTPGPARGTPVPQGLGGTDRGVAVDGRLLPLSSLAGATGTSPSSPEQERVEVEGKVDRRGDTGLSGVGESL